MKRDLEEAWTQIVRGRIGQARQGDRTSAIWMMQEYTRALANDVCPVREIVAYFGTAFLDILELERDGKLNDRSISEALGLTRPKQRPQDSEGNRRNRELVFSLAVWDCKQAASGISDSKAITNAMEIVRTWNAPWLVRGSWKTRETDRERFLKDAWKRRREELDAMPKEWLDEIRSWSKQSRPPQVDLWPTPGFEEEFQF